MSRPKVDAVIAAMETLLTDHQIGAVNSWTPSGASKLEAIRYFINLGIAAHHAKGRRFVSEWDAQFVGAAVRKALEAYDV